MTARKRITRSWRAFILDGAPALSAAMLAFGWAFVEKGSWWAPAIAVPAVLISTIATLLLTAYRTRHDKLRTVAVALVRHYWADVPDHRADALYYVPGDILVQASREESGHE